MKQIKSIALFVAATAIFVSCKKDDVPVTAPKVTTGLYVLSEGKQFGNNTTLTYYKPATGTATTDFWTNTNGSGLGDTGNDMLLYGGKLYIIVNVSSTVEVAEALTAKRIKQLKFETSASVKRQPRYAVAYRNKVLVSSYDGTVAVIDTTSLAIEKYITVGTNPEQMVIVGSKLYVANSGGLNASGIPDSTVSVVDLGSMTETGKIRVGWNPGSITADNAGNIYVGCTGDYFSVPPKLVKVNTVTGTVVKSADTAVGRIRYYNGLLYATGGYLGSSKVRTLNTTDFAATSANWVTDGTAIAMPYGINIDEANGDVYVTDAKNFTASGEVFCFDRNGKKKFSFSVAPGINPNTVVIIKQ